MKRSLNDTSARSTAGCLPVPLFNQKKRNRQPLTSNPLKNDPGISATLESYDFPPLPTDWAWDIMNPEVPPLKEAVNTGQIAHSVAHPLRSQDTALKSIQSSTEKGKSGCRDGNKNTGLKTWDRNDFRPQCTRTNLVANDGINPCPRNFGFQQQEQSRLSEPPKLSHQRETKVLQLIQSSKTSGSTMRSLDKNSAFQAIKPDFQQNQYKKKVLSVTAEKDTVQETPLYQLQFKEKDNSLRIISAVIESMKYWHEHAQRTILLFEILAVLDSAVIPGPSYSKTFVMRDGKSTLPCVFYEIDRELPRLIRGRVHRCVGNYDQKKNIFKCVSVRPASVAEQKTFQAFVKIGDAEMKYCAKVMNEM